MNSSNFEAGIVGPVGVRGPARWERPMGARPPIPRVMRRGFATAGSVIKAGYNPEGDSGTTVPYSERGKLSGGEYGRGDDFRRPWYLYYADGGDVSPLSAYAAQTNGPVAQRQSVADPSAAILQQMNQRAMMARPGVLNNVMNAIRQAGPTVTNSPSTGESLMYKLMQSGVNRPSLVPTQTGALGSYAHGGHVAEDGLPHFDDGGLFSGIGDAISGAGSWISNLFSPSSSPADSSSTSGANWSPGSIDMSSLMPPSAADSSNLSGPSLPGGGGGGPGGSSGGSSGGTAPMGGGKSTLANLMPLLMAALVLPGMFNNKKASTNPSVLKGQVTAGSNFNKPLANNNWQRTITNPISTDSYYTYGQRPEAVFFGNNQLPTGQAKGGDIHGRRGVGALGQAAGEQGHVMGPGSGQSDSVPAMLSDGEFVHDATFVSDIGDGSNRAGAQKLEKLRALVAQDKGRNQKVAPKAKPIEHYARKAGILSRKAA